MKINDEQNLIDMGKATASGAIGILGIVLLTILFALAEKRGMEMNLANCPAPGAGQELIGQGHAEADGYPGELYCTYSIPSLYDREQAGTQDEAVILSRRHSTET